MQAPANNWKWWVRTNEHNSHDAHIPCTIWQTSHWNRCSPLELPANYIAFSTASPHANTSTIPHAHIQLSSELRGDEWEVGHNTICESNNLQRDPSSFKKDHGPSACWQWHNDGTQKSNQLLMNASRSRMTSLREGPTSEQRRWQEQGWQLVTRGMDRMECKLTSHTIFEKTIEMEF